MRAKIWLVLVALCLFTPVRAAIPEGAIHAPMPKHPDRVKLKAPVSGVFTMSVTPAGKVKLVLVVHTAGDPLLDREGVRTLKNWRFTPVPPRTVQLSLGWKPQRKPSIRRASESNSGAKRRKPKPNVLFRVP